MPQGASPEEAFCTLVTAIGLTTLLTGLFFLCLGVFQLGGLVRYLPYPVVGGFLAGTGWLLFKGGFFLMNGTVTYLNLFNPAYIGHWLPGLLLAVIMFILSKQIQSSFILPSLILGGTLIFFTVAWLMGHLPAELSLQGWLLGPIDDRTLWRPLSFAQIRMADWHVIVGQSANITTVMMVSSLSILLNASGLELVAKKDIDLNKELRTTGIGNLLSGLSPGYIGFMQISLTALNFKMNARSRMVGMIAVTLIGLAIAFGASIIVYFPKMIMGAVLMYLGMTFLYEWIYKTWFALPGIDVFIIWMILIVITVFGFLPGIAIGFMAAVIMFAISCSHTEVVRHELTGKSSRSRVTRPINQRQVLDREGDKLYVLQLQGFIFFGTADRLFNKIKNRLNNNSQPQARFVILDFRRVATMDSTGMLSFRKLKDLTNDTEIHIIITSPSLKIRRQLEKGGLPASNDFIHYFSDLDAGLEWYEEMILRKTKVSNHQRPYSLAEQLQSIVPEDQNVTYLLSWLERKEVAAGKTIIRQGEKSDHIIFIESGRLTAQIDRPDGTPIRLESTRNSQVLGEIGFYLGINQTASVVTDERSVIYRISVQDLKTLEEQSPETASLLHRVVAYLMAERVAKLIKTINVLQKERMPSSFQKVLSG
jgi:SulP family sulfate permease